MEGRIGLFFVTDPLTHPLPLQFPFSKDMTRVAPFYNENGQVIAQVPMMNQEANFPTVYLAELAGTALELPYGSLEWMSMIAVLPNEKVTLNTVVNKLKTMGLQRILQRLAEYKMKNSDAMIDVSMPKFETTTDLSLNDILNQVSELFKVIYR